MEDDRPRHLRPDSMLEALREELSWLNELAALCRSARSIPVGPDPEALRAVLVRKEELLGALRRRTEARRADAERAGLAPDDLGGILRACVGAERGEDLERALAAHRDAAANAAREVEMSRDFYRVALDAVQSSLDALYRARDGSEETYRAPGAGEDGASGVWVSRLA